MKRIFDLVLAALAGIFLLLPILLVALAVRLTSKGPVDALSGLPEMWRKRCEIQKGACCFLPTCCFK